jgi:hypothetical protein
MALRKTYKRGISARPFKGDGPPSALTFDMFELVREVV